MFQMNLWLVYFIYGLAFFSMGLAMALEAGRSPSLAEAQILRPLAVFGLIHGLHEWLEIFIVQAEFFGVEVTHSWLWFRLALLAFSFISLVAYGVQAFSAHKLPRATDIWVGSGLLVLYLAVILLTGAFSWQDPHAWVARADVLARYMLAIPGALLTFLVLHQQSKITQLAGREKLSQSLGWSAWGFFIYGLSQFFVPAANMFPASLLNADWFSATFFFPIQILRALVAVMITAGLIRATQIVEMERQAQLLVAREDRLEALQQVQAELVKREQLRRSLLRHIVQAQEDERARISQELHDETSQLLTAFTLDLAALRSYLPDQERVLQIMARLQSLSRRMSETLYRLVHDLRPAQLDDLGLVPALDQLGEIFQQQMNLHVVLTADGTPRRLEPTLETVLFRVVQEALTNIARHAHTHQAEVQLTYAPNVVQLIVCDHGAGFDYDEAHASPKGWGLVGMRERVRTVDGQFKLQSQLGKGTCIEITVPLLESNQAEMEAETLT